MINFIQNVDFTILNFIQEHCKNPIIDFIMVFISTLGNYGFLFIVLTIVFLCIKKLRKVGIALLIALLIGFVVVNLILKPGIARIRPYEINQSIELIISKLSDYSFPSGHTLIAFEFATVIFLYNKKIGIISFVFAILMGFSRLYLYVHYPTDVLTGAILGIIFGIIGYKLQKIIYNKFLKTEQQE